MQRNRLKALALSATALAALLGPVSSHMGLQLHVAAWGSGTTNEALDGDESAQLTQTPNIDMEREVLLELANVILVHRHALTVEHLGRLLHGVFHTENKGLPIIRWLVVFVWSWSQTVRPAEAELSERLDRINQLWGENDQEGACQTALDFIYRCLGLPAENGSFDEALRAAEFLQANQSSDAQFEQVKNEIVYGVIQRLARNMTAYHFCLLVLSAGQTMNNVLPRLRWAAMLVWSREVTRPAEEELNERLDRINQLWSEEEPEGACQTALDFIKRCMGLSVENRSLTAETP